MIFKSQIESAEKAVKKGWVFFNAHKLSKLDLEVINR